MTNNKKILIIDNPVNLNKVVVQLKHLNITVSTCDEAMGHIGQKHDFEIVFIGIGTKPSVSLAELAVKNGAKHAIAFVNEYYIEYQMTVGPMCGPRSLCEKRGDAMIWFRWENERYKQWTDILEFIVRHESKTTEV